jgi:hypothetical protein
LANSADSLAYFIDGIIDSRSCALSGTSGTRTANEKNQRGGEKKGDGFHTATLKACTARDVQVLSPFVTNRHNQYHPKALIAVSWIEETQLIKKTESLGNINLRRE